MKQDRQNKILQLIEKYEIGTQQELTDMLAEAGFDATQATVSRDIRELGLSKIAGSGGRTRYVARTRLQADLEGKYNRVLRDAVTGVDTAQNILVVRTVAGMAMAVAAALDALEFPELVGCIAGDDTIMAATKGFSDCERLKGRIEELID